MTAAEAFKGCLALKHSAERCLYRYQDTSETPNAPGVNDLYFVAMKETKSIVE